MVATRAERRSAAEAGLRIQRLEYFTLPVRDLEVARRFYCEVVGGTELPDAGRPRTLKIKLFESDVLLYLAEQNAGQPRTDDTNPHFAFEVTEPGAFRAFQDRLHAFAIPVLGPMTGMQIPAPPAGTLVHAQIYFDDPDGNHLEVDCNVFPFVEGMPMKPFGEKPYDPWKLFYSWREWSDTYVFDSAAARLADSPAPRLVGLNHYTLPVRDLARAKLFYTDVLGGEAIPTFAEAYQVEHGLPVTPGSLVYVRLCAEELDRIVLGEQAGGWPPPDVHHPQQAYAVPAADLERWMQHFDAWEISYELVYEAPELRSSGAPGHATLFFFDPDGNHLALGG